MAPLALDTRIQGTTGKSAAAATAAGKRAEKTNGKRKAPAVDEAELMRAYVQGDKTAFDELFRSLAPSLRALFLRKFGSAIDADDLLQSTFLKVHRARKTYRVGSPLRPWVFTIANRVGVDALRRRKRRPEDLNEKRLERATRAASVARAAEADLVERGEIAAHVREALDKLPASQRIVVQLHRFEGLTFDEIGRVLDKTEGAMKLRAFRAYETLRETLAPMMG